jgi:hypothetical protein
MPGGELAAETIHVVAAIKTSAYCSERADAFEADAAARPSGIRRLPDSARRGHKGSRGRILGQYRFKGPRLANTRTAIE